MKKNLTNNIKINLDSYSGTKEGNLLNTTKRKSINTFKVNVGKTITGKLKPKNINSKKLNVKPGQKISGIIKKK